MKRFLITLSFFFCEYIQAQPAELNSCNIIWNSQSENSSESMPCGGGDIGLNVWVEKGDIFFYLSQSGMFDENNGFLKAGRVRVTLSPNPFDGKDFKQELVLRDGQVVISGSNNGINASVTLWVDVFRPGAHVIINSNKAVKATATYESWRYKDRLNKTAANKANSYKWASQFEVKTFSDDIRFENNEIVFCHNNKDHSVFDITVNQQGLDSVKEQLFNPLSHLRFGGVIQGKNMKAVGTTEGKYLDTDFMGWKLESTAPSRFHNLDVFMHTGQYDREEQWRSAIASIVKDAQQDKKALAQTLSWWKQYWERSYVFINHGMPDTAASWQVGRNYQLFRYMLGCNAYGKYPTKFNGGLFTFDPVFTETSNHGTPDYRNWGGGTMTAQNQRLVYFPMLKGGDIDMMKPQFDFYLRNLRNAELRSAVYWGHKGASFTEQIENFGLPNMTEYGWNRPDGYDKGIEYNAWLEYEWDTVLEFCLMMLETETYGDKDISSYLPFIESCLRFFNEHYQYLAKLRGIKVLDGSGQLILYPGSGGETFKMAYNSTSTISALQTVIKRLLALPAKYKPLIKEQEWSAMLNSLPPISFSSFGGHPTIAPAKLWERVNNTEPTQLYPVFPWGIYGVGKPGLDTAINTWKYDTLAIKFRSHSGWKQDNIFAARLGLTEEAVRLNTLKLKNSARRFPAFWGPGFDWTPDHNWGGAGMIGVQEMLLQASDKNIYLFPAWPKEWDVHFKLHAPRNTTVEAVLKNGKVEYMKVTPESRRKDVIMMLP